MRKEAVLIIGAIMTLLSLLNITLTPEDMELLEALVQAGILLVGAFVARSQVASKESVSRKGFAAFK